MNPTRKRKSYDDKDQSAKLPKIVPDRWLDSEFEDPTIELFADTEKFLKSLEEAAQIHGHAATTSPGGSSLNTDSGIGETTDSDGSNVDPSATRLNPAWQDEDDDIVVGQALKSQSNRWLPNGGVNSRKNEYKNLLAHKFTKLVGTPKWASLEERKLSGDEEYCRVVGSLMTDMWHGIYPKQSFIFEGTIEIKKLNDVNSETYTEGPIVNCSEFHPKSTVALVAGQAGIMSLFAVDGQSNNKLHSVQFKKFPIYCAHFASDGNTAIIGSSKPHYYTYDLIAAKSLKAPTVTGLTNMKQFVISPDGRYVAVAGRWGEIHVLHMHSKERLFYLKLDGEVTALTFNTTSDKLFGHSDSGQVSVFDMGARRLVHKFADEGCLQGTALSVSGNNQFLAAASAQGVVNVYDIASIGTNPCPTPRKSIMNLVTGISSLSFNNTGELLGFASSEVDNAMKLFHVESNTVFKNFPMFSNRLGKVTTVNMSPNGGYLALGNTNATVALYRLKHYNNY